MSGRVVEMLRLHAAVAAICGERTRSITSQRLLEPCLLAAKVLRVHHRLHQHRLRQVTFTHLALVDPRHVLSFSTEVSVFATATSIADMLNL